MFTNDGSFLLLLPQSKSLIYVDVHCSIQYKKA